VKITRGLAALVLAVTVCSCGGAPRGTALDTNGSTEVGVVAMPPGDRIGFLAVGLDNSSHQAITLRSVLVRGPGIGTVARVTQVAIVPPSGVPGMLYDTDPPTLRLGDGHCYSGPLVPVSGYRMKPGGRAWLWEVFEAVRPGRWRVPAHPFTYTQGGTTYHQVVTQADYGTVRLAAPGITPTNLETPCLRDTHLLNPARATH